VLLHHEGRDARCHREGKQRDFLPHPPRPKVQQKLSVRPRDKNHFNPLRDFFLSLNHIGTRGPFCATCQKLVAGPRRHYAAANGHDAKAIPP
jgi:hypothetical protein